MVYYDSSGKTGIVDDVLFKTNNNTTSYPLVDITRNINIGYGEIIAVILRNDKKWKFDDTNQTLTLEATFNLSTGVSEYGLLASIPDAAQDWTNFWGIEIKDSNGNWLPLKPITRDDVKRMGYAWDEYKDTSATPDEYMIEGTQLYLKAAPNYDSSDGGKIYMQRNPSYFASTDTTKVPGFASNFHYLLSLYGQRGWWEKVDQGKVALVQQLIDRGLVALAKFYSQRNQTTNKLQRARRIYA